MGGDWCCVTGSGEVLLERAAETGVNTLDLGQIKDGKAAVCVKLLCGRDLVDVVGVSMFEKGTSMPTAH